MLVRIIFCLFDKRILSIRIKNTSLLKFNQVCVLSFKFLATIATLRKFFYAAVKSSKTCFHFQLYNMQSISQQLEVCSSMAEAAWREGFLSEVALHRFAQSSTATAETFPYWFRRKWPDPH